MPAGARYASYRACGTEGDGRWRCGVCQWRCSLAAGETGRCLVRTGAEDGIEVAERRPDQRRELSARSKIIGYGTSSPTRRCWRSAAGAMPSRPISSAASMAAFPTRKASAAALSLSAPPLWRWSGCAAAWSGATATLRSRSSMSREMLQFSRASSRYTALVTSGYSTIAALDQLGHYLDGISLELRAFDDAAYKRLAGVEHWRGILEVVAHARQRWNCHVEVTTRLHPERQRLGRADPGAGRLDARYARPEHALARAAGRRRRGGGGDGRARAAAGPRGRPALRLWPRAGPDHPLPPVRRTRDRARRRRRRVVGIADGRCDSCGADPQMRLSIFKR